MPMSARPGSCASVERLGRDARALVGGAAARRFESARRAAARDRGCARHDPKRRLGGDRDPASAPAALGVAREVFDAIVADGHAEVLRGDVLELVRFVQDRGGAVGDDLAVRALPHGGIREQQVVVDDDEIGLGGALAHARDEAVADTAGTRVPRQFSADAAISLQSGRSSGRSFELRAIAGVGRARPAVDDRQQDPLVHLVAASAETAEPLLPRQAAVCSA